MLKNYAVLYVIHRNAALAKASTGHYDITVVNAETEEGAVQQALKKPIPALMKYKNPIKQIVKIVEVPNIIPRKKTIKLTKRIK